MRIFSFGAPPPAQRPTQRPTPTTHPMGLSTWKTPCRAKGNFLIAPGKEPWVAVYVPQGSAPTRCPDAPKSTGRGEPQNTASSQPMANQSQDPNHKPTESIHPLENRKGFLRWLRQVNRDWCRLTLRDGALFVGQVSSKKINQRIWAK